MEGGEGGQKGHLEMGTSKDGQRWPRRLPRTPRDSTGWSPRQVKDGNHPGKDLVPALEVTAGDDTRR